VAVVGAAAPAEDARAEGSVYLPHLVGEAFGVVAFGVVEPDELLGAQGDALALNSFSRRATRSENTASSRRAPAAMDGWTQLIA
jgi:hypothetical protein